MGYRSEVAIGLTDCAVRLLATLMEHDENLQDLISSADKSAWYCAEVDRPDRPVAKMPFEDSKDYGCNFHWDYVKWYEDYEDIAAMTSFLNALPTEDFRFVRVGENAGDIEEMGDYYDCEIYVQRSVSW